MDDLQLHSNTLLSIINASPVGMLLVSNTGKPVFNNTAAEKIFDVEPDELLKLNIADLVPSHIREKHHKLQKEYLKNPKSIQMGKGREVRALKKTGEIITIEAGLSPVVLNDQVYILVSIIDISDRLRIKELEKKNKELEAAATRDVLTGLPNRRLVLKLIENQKNLAIRSGSQITVMFFDLDGFKTVNDQYGHSVGDQLLCEVARVLAAQIRRSDVVGRLGGDEFLLCFTDLGNSEDIRRMADHLLKVVADIRLVGPVTLKISASIGAFTTPVDSHMDVADIISKADELMYAAKKNGKGIAVIKNYHDQ